jgi:hypothetical protein
MIANLPAAQRTDDHRQATSKARREPDRLNRSWKRARSTLGCVRAQTWRVTPLVASARSTIGWPAEPGHASVSVVGGCVPR